MSASAAGPPHKKWVRDDLGEWVQNPAFDPAAGAGLLADNRSVRPSSVNPAPGSVASPSKKFIKDDLGRWVLNPAYKDHAAVAPLPRQRNPTSGSPGPPPQLWHERAHYHTAGHSVSSSSRYCDHPPPRVIAPRKEWERYDEERENFAEHLQDLELTATQQEAINMNIDRRHLDNWTLAQATDEFVQNWHDQILLTVKDSRYAQRGDVSMADLRFVVRHGAENPHMEEFPGVYTSRKNPGQPLTLSEALGNAEVRRQLVRPPEEHIRTPARVEAEYLADASPNTRASRCRANEPVWNLAGDFVVVAVNGKTYWLGCMTQCDLLYGERVCEALKLINCAAVIPPAALVQGYTGEEKNKNKDIAKGKFGDGLLSACTVFTKSGGSSVIIGSCNFSYNFFFRPSSHRRQDLLHYKVAGGARAQRCLGSVPEVCASGLWSSDRDTVAIILQPDFRRDRYLFLNPGYHRACLQCEKYEVLIGPSFCGRVYVKGMLVEKLPAGGRGSSDYGRGSRKIFGCNLLRFEMMCRDRVGSIGGEDEKREIASAWIAVIQRMPEAVARHYRSIRDRTDPVVRAVLYDPGWTDSVGPGGQRQTRWVMARPPPS